MEPIQKPQLKCFDPTPGSWRPSSCLHKLLLSIAVGQSHQNEKNSGGCAGAEVSYVLDRVNGRCADVRGPQGTVTSRYATRNLTDATRERILKQNRNRCARLLRSSGPRFKDYGSGSTAIPTHRRVPLNIRLHFWRRSHERGCLADPASNCGSGVIQHLIPPSLFAVPSTSPACVGQLPCLQPSSPPFFFVA